MSEARVLILAALDIGTTNVKGEARLYVDGQLDQSCASGSVSLGFSNGLVRVEHFEAATREVLHQIFAGLDIQPHLAGGVRPRLAISQLGEAFFAVDAHGEVIGGVLHTSQSSLGRRVMTDPGGYDLARLQEETARHAGVPATDEMTSVMLLDWLREEPDLEDRMTYVASAGGYLIWRLTGERATTMSVLGREGLADMRASDVSERLLELCGFRSSWFPRVVPYGQPVAMIQADEAERIGLPPSLVLYPQNHDQCAAYEGATALAGLDFGVRTILTGTANGICAPSRGSMTGRSGPGHRRAGLLLLPGPARGRSGESLLPPRWRAGGEPGAAARVRTLPGRCLRGAGPARVRVLHHRAEPIESTYVPCRLMSFPVNRFPQGRSFTESFRSLPDHSGPLTDRSRLRDSLAGQDPLRPRWIRSSLPAPRGDTSGPPNRLRWRPLQVDRGVPDVRGRP